MESKENLDSGEQAEDAAALDGRRPWIAPSAREIPVAGVTASGASGPHHDGATCSAHFS